jgi:diguanylate cyclase (GGDEF)-like protein
MLDLDKFKSINDRYGHPVGDEVLESVANSIRKIVGMKGTSYRYGGEELAILLANYTSDEAAALAERLRRTIEMTPVGSGRLRVTASFGVAEVPTHTRTADELLKLADKAMYEAKTLGRNLVRISGEPQPSASEPKVTSRRQPEPGGISDEQIERIRKDYFQKRSARCPNDNALLNVYESHELGKRTPDLFVSCPMCGLNSHLEGLSELAT